MEKFGHVRVCSLSPRVQVGNPNANVAHILKSMETGSRVWNADIILLPELAITGYTCGDLFQQANLIAEAEKATLDLAQKAMMHNHNPIVVVGCPVAVNNSRYNCAVVLQSGRVLGIVPKQFLPNYREFYELRWFRPADGNEPSHALFGNELVPFGTDLLFESGKIKIGIEICEDLWMPIPPSSYQALAGATILLNCSASNETVGKAKYRRSLVEGQSARCIAAYAYASCNWEESTSDLVFGGHCLIAENGNMLNESSRVGGPNSMDLERGVVADVDVERLLGDRCDTTSFDQHPNQKKYRHVPVLMYPQLPDEQVRLYRFVNGLPFVPQKGSELKDRCMEVFGIQVAGLTKRLKSAKVKEVTIGVSGGLDSTLALLVTHKAFAHLGLPTTGIHGITMPGFGTTDKTKKNAVDLMIGLNISQSTIDIRPAAMQSFRDLGHKPFGIDLGEVGKAGELGIAGLTGMLKNLPPEKRHDLVFENVQARLRTFFLFSKGFVIGTGDLSEAALGWCTYNGDHMSSYNPNCSIPKTLVKFLVEWAAKNEYQGEMSQVLMSIVGTEISPELLPPDAQGNIAQSTETVLGPYELHDFFLMNFKRYGFSPEKIMFLAEHAEFGRDYETGKYSKEVIKKTMRTFITRFFGNQFKRNCVPDGPKVGNVSLSPRGDWRMPSDADVTLWLEGLDASQK